MPRKRKLAAPKVEKSPTADDSTSKVSKSEEEISGFCFLKFLY